MYSRTIEQLQQTVDGLQSEVFEPAQSGTHHTVFCSERYVVRFRDKMPVLLERETNFLKRLDHPLIPRVVWIGNVDGTTVMVEERLPGESLDRVWRGATARQQESILRGMREFIVWMRHVSYDQVFSLQTGKTYESFRGFIQAESRKRLSALRNIQDSPLRKQLDERLSDPAALAMLDRGQTTLVHGDLIMHNILVTDGTVTGILDWEMALQGDPDFDLARLEYYEECAMAYEAEGIDLPQEYEYMRRLNRSTSRALKTGKEFENKNEVFRAFFYLRALSWAVASDNSKRNIAELERNWKKKRAKRESAQP